MNFEIKREVLMKHLNYVIKGISTKNLRPILNCIKFDLTKEGLYLESTDNEIAIRTFIDKKDIESDYTCGKIVLAGKYIFDIVRKMPNNIIKIEEVVDSKVFISSLNSSFTLNCNKVADFPNLELEDHKNPIVLNQRIFKTIISQTAFATSNQESRPVLTGINIKIENDCFECTATDSYRLAKKKITLENSVSETVNIIVPTKNLIELTRLLNEDEDQLEIHIFNNKVIFKFDTIVMLSKLINGSYPDTSKLIPSDFLLEMELKYNDFYDLLDRVSLLSNEEEKNTIKLESNGSEIIVSSNIPEIGNVEEKIAVNKNNENEIKIAFSSKYMMEAIKALNCEEISLLFNGDVKPIIIKNKTDDNLIQLIVPIRTY